MNVDRTLVAVADASPLAGLGHLSRSSAVIAGLMCRGIDVRSVALDAAGAITVDGVSWEPCPAAAVAELVSAHQVVLLDSYTLAERELGGEAPLASFHDPGTPAPQMAQLVIAPAVSAPKQTRWLSGFRYACLRPCYWGVERVSPAPEVARVLVSTGATDPGGIAVRLVAAVRRALPLAEIRRVRGPGAAAIDISGVEEVFAPSDMWAELTRSDLVVCLGGQTALEAACLGVPTVAIAAVENQLGNVEALAGAGAVVTPAPGESLDRLIRELAEDHERRARQSAAACALVDGYGALRVAARIFAALGN